MVSRRLTPLVGFPTLFIIVNHVSEAVLSDLLSAALGKMDRRVFLPKEVMDSSIDQSVTSRQPLVVHL